MKVNTNILSDLFKKWSGNVPTEISPLPSSGSYRIYYRCSDGENSAIGAFNQDFRENRAFLSFTRHFLSQGIHVPEIYAQSDDVKFYLLQDLGDVTLYNHLTFNQQPVADTEKVRSVYQKVISQLLRIQILGGKGLDYSLCYPRETFDRQSMLWDLNYFKYHFLKLNRVLFDEQKLEDDFHTLIDFLLKEDSNHFMYRDFQSRNVMIHNDKIYFIDYQGGRRGALQYDLASLLFESKINLPASLREHLLDVYVENLSTYKMVNKQSFLNHYYAFALIRLLQAMGAYGFRGLYEQKALFIQSIPKGIKNLEFLYGKVLHMIQLPELYGCFDQLINHHDFEEFQIKDDTLTVDIFSFSYKKQKPVDASGNGGGFMFDCRSLPNPGRYAEYKTQTGKDLPVIAFLEKAGEVQVFLNNSFSMVDRAIENYQERKFTHLMVSFGCTGGQHRSVYAAEQLKKHLNQKYNLNVRITHMES